MVSEMIDQYIARFNTKFDEDERRKNGDTRKLSYSAKTVWNGFHYTVKRQGNFKIITNGTYTVYEAEYEASSTEGILSSTSTFNGKF
jgi:dTDP-4-dehydrorhamnose 3,5-epimerase-like enzyme